MKYTFEVYDSVWRQWYGSKKTATDPFGNKIIFDEYGKQTSSGWEIVHIWPLEPKNEKKRGANTFGNVVPMQYKYANNVIKLNKTSGNINGKKFNVRLKEYHHQKAVGDIYINNKLVSSNI